MLAGKGGHEEPDGDEGEGDTDPRAMAEASVKAFFQAGRAGDFAAATEHLAAAMAHCEDYDEDYDGGDGGEGEGGHYGHEGGNYGHALMILAPKGK